ncbi:MAG TPA: hydrogenase/urease maturation nickel metallochaperone HypA [Polyangiaceae bacterium]|nr:hydrogenase/urease maturation nickel metallochaperone HypA [Polyangiaceae bacterium]
MHEVSLVHALFDQVDRALVEHSTAALLQVTVRIGTMAGVESELFQTAFDGTKAERGYPVVGLQVVSTEGTDLILERMELEVRDV